ncbi:MAG: hypothetical protein IT328_13145 [Caldilineaceae bacterium]|nr:hypothetical protein [Caldilineaceae bacterium]
MSDPYQYSERVRSEEEITEKERGRQALHLYEGGIRLHPKLAGVLQSRKVWAGVIGVAATLLLWWLGEIDGARAVEALTWVLGIFIGSVAFEDGMTRLFSTLVHAVAVQEQSGVGVSGSEQEQEKKDERW